MIELYKDGNTMAIKTDADNEDDFISQMSELFGNMIGQGQFIWNTTDAKKALTKLMESDIYNEFSTLTVDEEGDLYLNNDWEFQFFHWLRQIVDICCKYRGYKNDVQQKQILVSGDMIPCKCDICAATET